VSSRISKRFGFRESKTRANGIHRLECDDQVRLIKQHANLGDLELLLPVGVSPEVTSNQAATIDRR